MLTVKEKEKHEESNASKTKDMHILIAMDETESAQRALLYVANFLGDHPGIYVTLLRIFVWPSEDYFACDLDHGEWRREQLTEANKMLENYRDILIHSGFNEYNIAIRIKFVYCPSIAEAILEEQRNLGCCTVVVGRRVISRREECLFGSTSSKILHASKNCAIWVIE